jgi:hypothetical protein
MSDFLGFQHSPHELVEAAFARIATDEMQDLPFLHPTMPVFVPGFTLFEGQWIGCVLTPWMLSLAIFPGPDQCWPREKWGEDRPATSLWRDDVYRRRTGWDIPVLRLFTDVAVGARSLRRAGKTLAQDCLRMVLSLPVRDPQLSRRALFAGLKGGEYA